LTSKSFDLTTLPSYTGELRYEDLNWIYVLESLHQIIFTFFSFAP